MLNKNINMLVISFSLQYNKLPFVFVPPDLKGERFKNTPIISFFNGFSLGKLKSVQYEEV